MEIGQDKILHFLISFIIALEDPLFSFVLGLGKEFLDLLGFGVAEFADLIANVLGILFALFITSL